MIAITGLPGSGKSYKAVHYIWKKHKEYEKIFCDIDGFKEFENARFQKFSEFRKIIEECYKDNVTEDKDFFSSIDILKNFGILSPNASKENRTLIIVDEAQNHFGTSAKISPSLVWLVTQHRHLYIELILLTQKYTLLRREYHLVNEFFEGVPPIKRISKKTFTYHSYASLPPSEKNYIGKTSIPVEQEVFNLYVSGDKVVNENPFTRFIWFFVLFVSMLIGGVYFFLNSFGTTSEELENDVKTSVRNTHARKDKEEKQEEKMYIAVIDKNEHSFYIVNYGSTFNSLPLKMFEVVKQKFKIKSLYLEEDSLFMRVYFSANKDFLYFLSLEDKRKKNRIQIFNN